MSNEPAIDAGALGDLPLWNEEAAAKMLQEVCKTHRMPLDVIAELVTVQRERQHQERAHGINLRFEEILGRIEE